MSNHFISLEQAVEMTTLYRVNRESILVPAERGKDILFISESFDREAFDVLLSETDAKGLRFYLGMDVNLQVRIIAVSTDSGGADILPSPGSVNLAAGDGKIVEVGLRCPTTCPATTSALGG